MFFFFFQKKKANHVDMDIHTLAEQTARVSLKKSVVRTECIRQWE